MKFIHLSDLHLGKRVNEFSMIEDQKYILEQITQIIRDEAPQAVFIAGDIYDRSVPSTEAVELFDNFLVRLAAKDIQIFIIAGNHDSPERLAFGSRLMEPGGIHISPVYSGEVRPVYLEDEFGRVAVFSLPFLKPANVRRFFPDAEISGYTDAVRTAVCAMDIDPKDRNILITHQFVTGAERSESEELSVGGADNVDASVFDGFDYVALGHIHGPQNIGEERIRYCGTPLKYSFSEEKHKKSVTVGELLNKGGLKLRTVELKPLRDLKKLRGTYAELMSRSYYENTTYTEDYVQITLTDEEEVMDAAQKLRTVYKNLMKQDYDNTRSRHRAELKGPDIKDVKQPLELFADFYEQQNGLPMNDIQRKHVRDLIEKIWEVR